MRKIRIWILRVHGTLLILGGVANAALSTWGMLTGDGLMGFLRANRLGHVGLVQAYLLVAVLGIALWLGSRQADPRPWNRIGALAHLAILPAYMAGAGNGATGCCTTPVGSRRSHPRQDQRRRRAGLLRAEDHRGRLEPEPARDAD